MKLRNRDPDDQTSDADLFASNDRVIEAIARVLARRRLGYESSDPSSPVPPLTPEFRQDIEDHLWPKLVDEAAAIARSLDALRMEEAAQSAAGEAAETEGPAVAAEEHPLVPALHDPNTHKGITARLPDFTQLPMPSSLFAAPSTVPEQHTDSDQQTAPAEKEESKVLAPAPASSAPAKRSRPAKRKKK